MRCQQEPGRKLPVWFRMSCPPSASWFYSSYGLVLGSPHPLLYNMPKVWRVESILTLDSGHRWKLHLTVVFV